MFKSFCAIWKCFCRDSRLLFFVLRKDLKNSENESYNYRVSNLICVYFSKETTILPIY